MATAARGATLASRIQKRLLPNKNTPASLTPRPYANYDLMDETRRFSHSSQSYLVSPRSPSHRNDGNVNGNGHHPSAEQHSKLSIQFSDMHDSSGVMDELVGSKHSNNEPKKSKWAIVKEKMITSKHTQSLFDVVMSPVAAVAIELLKSRREAEEEVRKRQEAKDNLVIDPDQVYFKMSEIPTGNHVTINGFFLPHTKFRKRWEIAIALLVLYSSIVTPFSAAYIDGDNVTLLVLDGMIDFAFLCHIIMNFRTAYWDSRILVCDWREIAKKYLALWFWVDLAATLPFNLILKSLSNVKLLRLLRLTRLLRAGQLTKIRTSSSLLQLFKLTGYLILLSHWTGACWFIMCDLEGFPEDNFCVSESLQQADTGHKFMRGFFWGIAGLTGLGANLFPETTLQAFWATVVAFVGVFAFAYIIGNIFTLIQTLNAASTRYQQTMAQVHEWIDFRQLPKDLSGRVVRNFHKMFDLNQGVDESFLMMQLSNAICQEISVHMYREFLDQVPMFNRCSSDFLDSLTGFLQPQFALENDFIVREGQMANEMYFIRVGKCSVTITEDGGNVKEVSTLQEGQFFGEIGLLSSQPRTASVRALVDTELLCLTRNDWETVIAYYGDASQVLGDVGKERKARTTPKQMEELERKAVRLRHARSMFSAARAFSSAAPAVAALRQSIGPGSARSARSARSQSSIDLPFTKSVTNPLFSGSSKKNTLARQATTGEGGILDKIKAQIAKEKQKQQQQRNLGNKRNGLQDGGGGVAKERALTVASRLPSSRSSSQPVHDDNKSPDNVNIQINITRVNNTTTGPSVGSSDHSSAVNIHIPGSSPTQEFPRQSNSKSRASRDDSLILPLPVSDAEPELGPERGSIRSIRSNNSVGHDTLQQLEELLLVSDKEESREEEEEE